MTVDWKPIEDLPPLKQSTSVRLLNERTEQWVKVREQLEAREMDKTPLEIWLSERNRSFAIGTGEVEGLYTLKRGITEQLITEGLHGIESSHTFEDIDRSTLQGLLADQEETLKTVFDMVKNDVPLSHYSIRGLHAKITEHQDTATGIDPFGRHTHMPLLKGQYKLRPNNPRRPDGEIHPYCPPEQTHGEMERLLTMHREHEKANVDMIAEAAWLHHRFAQIHPFQDGNGRIARLLMAYVFVKEGGFPPVVSPANRDQYIDALERADEGDLQLFVDFLADESSRSAVRAITIGDNIVRGVNRYIHANRGVTIDNQYFPPGTPEADGLHLPLETDIEEKEVTDKGRPKNDDDHSIDL
ncbi:MAG: Fic family protein [Gammaproteobacteria bacterium]|nr:Fic family protein [Gammaproteobacteria bacterium]